MITDYFLFFVCRLFTALLLPVLRWKLGLLSTLPPALRPVCLSCVLFRAPFECPIYTPPEVVEQRASLQLRKMEFYDGITCLSTGLMRITF